MTDRTDGGLLKIGGPGSRSRPRCFTPMSARRPTRPFGRPRGLSRGVQALCKFACAVVESPDGSSDVQGDVQAECQRRWSWCLRCCPARRRDAPVATPQLVHPFVRLVRAHRRRGSQPRSDCRRDHRPNAASGERCRRDAAPALGRRTGSQVATRTRNWRGLALDAGHARPHQWSFGTRVIARHTTRRRSTGAAGTRPQASVPRGRDTGTCRPRLGGRTAVCRTASCSSPSGLADLIDGLVPLLGGSARAPCGAG